MAKGESGALWIRAESAAKYYWNKPEKTAETMVDGWLNTGDTYREDPDGYFVYEGRSDDMLKVGGIWCSPIEIESCLITHPAVLEAAVVGQADAERADQAQGDRGAEAGRRCGGTALTEELMALCKKPGALQVPALDRVRARAAQDGDRQDPALQIEGVTVIPSAARVWIHVEVQQFGGEDFSGVLKRGTFGRVVVGGDASVEAAGSMVSRLVLRGKNLRRRPMVFSTAPFCQGLCGSQKKVRMASWSVREMLGELGAVVEGDGSAQSAIERLEPVAELVGDGLRGLAGLPCHEVRRDLRSCVTRMAWPGWRRS